MTTFLALYRGETISGASLVAVSADQKLVQDFAERMITDEPDDVVGTRYERGHRPSRNGNGSYGSRPTQSA